MSNEIEYQEGIENLREIASKTKTLIVLADIKQEINTLKSKINPFVGSDYDYCAANGANDAFSKTLEIIDLEIKKLKEI
jgi:ABC-type Fe3+-hydroxamate transport system substrate-binding protein